jgi:hypothetical protein
MTEEMPDLDPLVCIRCVRRVDPTSADADGWILVERNVLSSDPDDDRVWVCPDDSTALEREAFMAPIEKLRPQMPWPDEAA